MYFVIFEVFKMLSWSKLDSKIFFLITLRIKIYILQLHLNLFNIYLFV